ncbi:MAG TPA: hypothetical protein VN375_16060 [Vicinamibacteria bacterium]|jgi:2,4-dienoyl-CoA reductase-like NADH-dependent reductase (Old Yellow Enzyme family)|nr:hypothetical protein [Vicinamibacteria bacterium]
MVISALFESFTWRGKTSPTRIVFAPVNPGFAPSGDPTARLLRFQRERAGRAIGISYVGNVAIADWGRSSGFTPVVRTKRQANRFAVIRRAIERAGSLAGIQLALTPPELNPQRSWRASDSALEVARLVTIVNSLRDEEISSLLARFVSVADEVSGIGFDVVQLHAAHGYVLSLLMEPATNLRSGPFSARGQWIETFVDNLRNAIGPTLLSLRINARCGLRHAEAELADATGFALRLCKAGVDIIDFSAGIYTLDRRLIYPPERDVLPNLPAALRTATQVPNPIVFTGGVHDLRRLPDLPRNVFVGLGRPLIADPQFARKSRDGTFEDIVWCRRTNQCHYFSRNTQGLSCGVNEAI